LGSALWDFASSCFVFGIRVLPVSSVLSLFFFFSLSLSLRSPISISLFFFFFSLSLSLRSPFSFSLFFFFFFSEWSGLWSLVLIPFSAGGWWGGSPSPSSCSLYSLASPPFSIFVFSFLVVCQISVPCSI
jgi:hypothetical protein